MSIITNAPPPPGAPPPESTRIRPSGWWYLPAILVLAGGVIGGITLMVVGFVNLSRLVDDFARIEVVEGEGSERLVFDRAGRFVLYYEFESDIDGAGFSGADADLPAVLEATVRGPGTEGPLLLVRDERNDFSFSFSGNAGISFASVRIPEAGTYDVEIESSERSPFVVSVGPSVFGQLRGALLGGLALLGAGVVLGVLAIVVLAVKRGRRKRERELARPPSWPGGGYGYAAPWGTAPAPGGPPGWAPTPPPPPPWGAPPGSLPPPPPPGAPPGAAPPGAPPPAPPPGQWVQPD
jgi:hypothetical protein